MEKGICIVVTGHAYYGRFAYNLCASIKAVEPGFPVCVIHNGHVLSHLSADRLDLFDYIVQMDEGITATQMCKLYVTEYSPFEKTLLLDADMLWLPKQKPSDLFREVGGTHFTCITEGKETEVNHAYFFWAEPEEIKQKYDCKTELYQSRSEVVYFDGEGAGILKRALEVCKNPGLKTIKNFAHSVPDELGINIAMAEAGIGPHKYKWQPSYWPNMTGGVMKWGADLYQNYYLISFGSNSANGTLKRVYGELTQSAFNKIKKQNIFPLIEKKSFLPTIRNKM